MTQPPEGIGLAAFNELPVERARDALLACCSSRAWAERVGAGRPYASTAQLYAAADEAVAAMTEADLDEALAGHPRIGERPGSSPGSGHSASSAGWSAREQSGVAGSDELVAANREYEERFGHVYLVCATGKTGPELLEILRQRLGNDPATERRVVREELSKINKIRLQRLVEPDGGERR
ncbi:MAG: 2-oxo-4-hydroxy-4-carboxy-5-ureidoimidazoline decarboxylase [Actinomycetota bacterium]